MGHHEVVSLVGGKFSPLESVAQYFSPDTNEAKWFLLAPRAATRKGARGIPLGPGCCASEVTHAAVKEYVALPAPVLDHRQISVPQSQLQTPAVSGAQACRVYCSASACARHPPCLCG